MAPHTLIAGRADALAVAGCWASPRASCCLGTPTVTAVIQLTRVCPHPPSLQISGVHSDTITHKTSWCRQPYGMVKDQAFTPATGRSITMASNQGGPVYIRLSRKVMYGEIQIQISGGRRMPFFYRGQTTDAAWNAGIKDYAPPFGEIGSRKCVAGGRPKKQAKHCRAATPIACTRASHGSARSPQPLPLILATTCATPTTRFMMTLPMVYNGPSKFRNLTTPTRYTEFIDAFMGVFSYLSTVRVQTGLAAGREHANAGDSGVQRPACTTSQLLHAPTR